MSAPSDIVQALADQVEAALGEIADQPTAWIHRAAERAIANAGEYALISIVTGDPDLIGEQLDEHAYEISQEIQRALQVSSARHAVEAVGGVVFARILGAARASLAEDVLAELTHRQDSAEERAEQRRYYGGADALSERARDERLTSQPGCVSPEDAGVPAVGPV